MSFFPILIKYLDTNEEVMVNTSKDIESGRSFLVLKTNVK